MTRLLAIFANFDEHLLAFVERHGHWSYGVMFVVLTCEVGLVVTPFLPGETLLFAAGALAATDILNMPALLSGFACASLLGSICGYTFGRCFSRRLHAARRIPFVSPERMSRLRQLFDRSPKYALVYTRFIPFVRALSPFVAGAVAMSLDTFLVYSAIGGVLWVMVCTFAGYLFGHLPVVQDNFTLALIAVVMVASLPALYTAVTHRHKRSELLASPNDDGGGDIGPDHLA
jgi:membrane-associated protein